METQEPAVENEKNEERDERSGGINEGIPCRGTARGHENLVNFVEGRVARGDEPCGQSPGPAPAVTRTAYASIEEKKEDKVLEEMRAFADDVMDCVELVPG